MEDKQNDLLSSMEGLITKKLEASRHHKEFSQAQISRLQESIRHQDTYKFRKKSNEEQTKVNAHVLDKLNWQTDIYRTLPKQTHAKLYHLLKKKYQKVLRF